MGIPRVGILKREAAEQVHESLGVATKAVGFASEAVEADE